MIEAAEVAIRTPVAVSWIGDQGARVVSISGWSLSRLVGPLRIVVLPIPMKVVAGPND